jgi:hypothetical protein
MRAICITCVAALTACSVAPPDIGSKGCPCVDGFTCKIVSKQCSQVETAPVASIGCVVYIDGKLYCANNPGSDLHVQPTASSDVVNHLATPYSWFMCWGIGELHAGGSTTWYFTDGDIRGAPNGWLPSVDVNTPSVFDADPAAYGFLPCPPGTYQFP